MNLALNKDSAIFLQNAIEYFLKMGAINWYKTYYPNVDLQELFTQLKIIEMAEN